MLNKWWWWLSLLIMFAALGESIASSNILAVYGCAMAIVWQVQHAWTFGTLLRLADAYERAARESRRWQFMRRYLCLRPLEGHLNHRTIDVRPDAEVQLVIDTSGPRITGETLDEAVDWAIERQRAENAAIVRERIEHDAIVG